VTVPRGTGCACVRAWLSVESTQGSDCIDQPLPGSSWGEGWHKREKYIPVAIEAWVRPGLKVIGSSE